MVPPGTSIFELPQSPAVKVYSRVSLSPLGHHVGMQLRTLKSESVADPSPALSRVDDERGEANL